MERVTVYLNEIPVLVLPWMEVRHVLYSRQIPFEERDAVLGGVKIILDSNQNPVSIDDKIKEEEHYVTIDASSSPHDITIPKIELPDLSQIIKSIKFSNFGQNLDPAK